MWTAVINRASARRSTQYSYPITPVPYDQVRTVESTLVMTGQICALREGDRNLNRVKRGIYLSDLNVGSLDSDGLESSGLSQIFAEDDGILV